MEESDSRRDEDGDDADAERGMSEVADHDSLLHMTEDDLRAIWLHIQTVPAINNVVPENEIKGS